MAKRENKDEQSSSEAGDTVVEKAETDDAVFKSYWRIFSYTDAVGWMLNTFAFVAACASGAALPLMDLIFGKTVTTFNNFGINAISPDLFRSQTTKWT
jgi:ATP-binding cassette subfamily B (MDR/TAP) protein 1